MDGGYEDQMYMILTLEYSNPPPNITNRYLLSLAPAVELTLISALISTTVHN